MIAIRAVSVFGIAIRAISLSGKDSGLFVSSLKLSLASISNSASSSPPGEGLELAKQCHEVSTQKPARKTRTKSGCLTCRIRRVKCDEAKPACVRCTSTGRKCDGYPSTNRAVSKPPTSLPGNTHTKSTIIPGPGFAGSSLEQRGLYYFRSRTALALSGYFYSEFWNKLVLQVSETEPTVRHAVLALSSIHESIELRGDVPSHPNDTYHRFALQEYNKAVALTVSNITAGNCAQAEVTLIVCILFICLELFQNNYGTAIDHLKYGLRILSNRYSALRPDETCPAKLVAAGSSQSLKRSLSQIFTRLIIQTIFLGTPYHKGAVMSPNLDKTLKPFSGISDARESLDNLFVSVYLFLRSVKDGTPSVAHQKPEKYTTLLLKWHAFFLDFIYRQRHTFTPTDSTAATVLQLHYISLYIILTTTLNPSVTALESLTPSFARIIALTETLLGTTPTTSPNIQNSGTPPPPLSVLPTCSFDMGMIQPLYYTALRCRSSPLRWRAIALLRLAPPREGIWGAAMTAQMAQRIVEIEEETGDPLKNQFGEPNESEGLSKSVLQEAMLRGQRVKSIPVVHDPIGDGSGTEAESGRFWTVRFTSPGVHERSIKMQIGKSERDIKGGRAREEVITW